MESKEKRELTLEDLVTAIKVIIYFEQKFRQASYYLARLARGLPSQPSSRLLASPDSAFRYILDSLIQARTREVEVTEEKPAELTEEDLKKIEELRKKIKNRESGKRLVLR